jgi:hypothetical protein
MGEKMLASRQRLNVLLTTLACVVLSGHAQAKETWRFDGGVSLTRFEQQIKTEIGGERGERLVEALAFGFSGTATHRVWGPLSAGMFTRFDIGRRSAARFERIVDERTVTMGEVGGDYNELWVGPLIRAQWKTLFAELGYGLVGLRNDDARDDLVDQGGDNEAALNTSRTVAWILNLGGGVPINKTLELAIRLEYRVRYYDRRDEPLVDKLVHGTQNYTPFIGVAWTP